MDTRLVGRLLRLDGATATISDEHEVMISVSLDVLAAFVAKYTEYHQLEAYKRGYADHAVETILEAHQ